MNFFVGWLIRLFGAGFIVIFSCHVYADIDSDLTRVAINKVKEQKLVDSFRKSLKEGDDTNCGSIIEIKNKLIKVSNAVANYGNEPWLKRDQIFPQGYTCHWYNGEYELPQLKTTQEEEDIRAREAEEQRKQEQAAEAEKRKKSFSQEGLTWMPIRTNKTWEQATDYCANAVINGQTGWRLPTLDELSGLYASGAPKAQGLSVNVIWSSTPSSSGHHYVVSLNNGYVASYYADTTSVEVTCVR